MPVLMKRWSHLVSVCVSLGLVNLSGCLPQPDPAPASQPVLNFFPAPVSQSAQPVAQPRVPNPAAVFSGYDWSRDRVGGEEGAGSFGTKALSDTIRPKLDLPAAEQRGRIGSNAGEFNNEFAKSVSGQEENLTLPSTPAVLTADNSAYFLTGSLSTTNFYKLSSTGQVAWQLSLHDNNGKFVGTSPGLGKARGEDTLYVISDVGRLYAVSAASGLVKAFTDIDATFRYTSPFVTIDEQGTPADTSDDNDRIYLTSQEGKVFEHTFNGTSFSRTYVVTVTGSSATGKFSTSPVITGSKTSPGTYIYAGSEEGKLYKLRRDNGTTVSSVDLTTLSRSAGCKIKGTLVIDTGLDVGIVPCGGYLFRVELKDAIPTTDFNFPNSAQMAVTAQSPLLELRNLQLYRPSKVLGPNHNNRAKVTTTMLREPKPTDTAFSLEQPFGFAGKDFVEVQLKTGERLYGQIDKLDKDKVTIKDKLFPIPSPSPDPLMAGTETVTLANQVVRSSPAPTQVVAAPVTDAVTRFTAGSVKELNDGDFIFFPALGSFTGFQICAPGSTACDEDGSVPACVVGGVPACKPYLGVNRDTNLVTVGGTALFALINGKGTVAFEKVQNRVIIPTSNTKFTLGDATGIQAGNLLRVSHQNGDDKGRHEFAIVETVVGREVTLTAGTALLDRPANGDRVEVVDNNRNAFGRIFQSLDTPSSDIQSSPVLRGGASKLVYLHHGNVLYEIDYNNTQNFSAAATFLVLQAGRLDHSNLSLLDAPRSTPLVQPAGAGVIGTRLLVTDTDPTGKTRMFMNRVLLPLNSTLDRLNDVFAIAQPNALGNLPRVSETAPVLFDTNFILFGGGNGIAYKLHKDRAW